MTTDTQESKLENFKVRTEAKAKMHEAQVRIQSERGEHAKLPTFTETLMILADHYLKGQAA